MARRGVLTLTTGAALLLPACTDGNREVTSDDGTEDVGAEVATTSTAAPTTAPTPSSAPAPAPTTTPAPEGLRTAADLREAARRTAEWDRGRMVLRSDVIAEGEGAVTATAEVTFVGDDMRMSVKVDAGASGQLAPDLAGFDNYEVTAVDGRAYLRGGLAAMFGAPTDRWVALPAEGAETFAPSPEQVSPAGSLGVLDAITGDVTPLGTDQLHGRPCQRAAAEVPLTALAEDPSAVWSEVPQVEGTTEGTARMEVWVCGGSLTKVRVAHASPGMLSDTVVEFLPLGSGAVIEAPPDALAVDPEDFLHSAFEAIGGDL